MTRLTQYITEDKSLISLPVDEINSLIQKDCQYYLRLIKGYEPLYRGMDKSIRFGKNNVRQGRISKGLSPKNANSLNAFLAHYGHVRRDKAVIATSDRYHAGVFGEAYMIFPIGKFNFSWVEAKDLNLPDKGWYGGYFIERYFKDFQIRKIKEWDISRREKIEKYEYITLSKPFKDYFTTNKGFLTAYTKGYEIWLDAKSYYFVRDKQFRWSHSTGLMEHSF